MAGPLERLNDFGSTRRFGLAAYVGTASADGRALLQDLLFSAAPVYTAALADSAATLEALTGAAANAGSLADASVTGETLMGSPAWAANQTDSAATGENLTAAYIAPGANGALDDPAGTSDLWAAVYAAQGVLNDGATTADSYGGVGDGSVPQGGGIPGARVRTITTVKRGKQGRKREIEREQPQEEAELPKTPVIVPVQPPYSAPLSLADTPIPQLDLQPLDYRLLISYELFVVRRYLGDFEALKAREAEQQAQAQARLLDWARQIIAEILAKRQEEEDIILQIILSEEN